MLNDLTFEFYKKDCKITQIDRLLNSSFDVPINYILNLSPEQKGKYFNWLYLWFSYN